MLTVTIHDGEQPVTVHRIGRASEESAPYPHTWFVESLDADGGRVGFVEFDIFTELGTQQIVAVAMAWAIRGD